MLPRRPALLRLSNSLLSTSMTPSRALTSRTPTFSLDGTKVEPEPMLKRAPSSKREKPIPPAMRHGLGAGSILASWEHDVLPTPEEEAPVQYLKRPKTVNLIGAPMSWGQPLAGTDHGPQLIRESGLVRALSKMGWRVSDSGDCPVTSPTDAEAAMDDRYMKETGANSRNASAVGRMLSTLALKTEHAAANGDFVMTVGGDHSIALGSLFGILKARPETGVLWVDAHADLHTPLSSESGNLHGMCVMCEI